MVSNFFQEFSQRFWAPDVWLPPNVTWEDIKPSVKIAYPNFIDIIWYPILFSFALKFIRLLFERYDIIVVMYFTCHI